MYGKEASPPSEPIDPCLSETCSEEAPLQRTRQQMIDELLTLLRTEIHLPTVELRDLTEDEERKLHAWMSGLSDEELLKAICEQDQNIDREVERQWPRGLAMA